MTGKHARCGPCHFTVVERSKTAEKLDQTSARFAGDDHVHLGGAEDFGHRLRHGDVGEELVDLRDMAQADNSAATELGVIGHEPDFAGLLDDGLGDAHFTVVIVEQRAVFVDAGDADDADVDAKLLHEVDRGLANDAAVAVAHEAAGDNDLRVRAAGEDRRDVQIIGDDTQTAGPVLADQCLGDFFGGRSNIDDERTAGLDVARNDLGDTPLGVDVQDLALVVVCLLYTSPSPRDS